MIFIVADAYKQADGRKIDNRRVLVDVERGRTVPNWRPRRLGGGLGSTRVGGRGESKVFWKVKAYLHFRISVSKLNFIVFYIYGSKTEFFYILYL